MSDTQGLRAALAPFVSWLDHVSATSSRRLEDREYPPVSGMPTMGELRAARAALSSLEANE